MKFEKCRTKTRQLHYVVSLSEYDAEPPVRALQIDEAPNTVNPEIEAMALYLIFGSWCGGEFHVAQKVGPNTASTMAEDSTVDFFVSPLEYYPKKLPQGTKNIRVSDSFADFGKNTFLSLSSSDWNGSVRSTDALAVATNAMMFMKSKSDYEPILGLALLYAETMSADTLEVPRSWFDTSTFTRLQSLLGAVRVGLKQY